MTATYSMFSAERLPKPVHPPLRITSAERGRHGCSFSSCYRRSASSARSLAARASNSSPGCALVGGSSLTRRSPLGRRGRATGHATAQALSGSWRTRDPEQRGRVGHEAPNCEHEREMHDDHIRPRLRSRVADCQEVHRRSLACPANSMARRQRRKTPMHPVSDLLPVDLFARSPWPFHFVESSTNRSVRSKHPCASRK